MHTDSAESQEVEPLVLSNCFREAQMVDACRRIGPVTLQVMSRDAALSKITQAVTDRNGAMFAFCNIHCASLAYSSPRFAAALSRMTIFNDGLGIDLASRLLFGTSFRENLNGTDLTAALLGRLPATRVFLLGSPPGVADRAAEILQGRYPHLLLVGTRDGYFPPEHAGDVARQIRSQDADLVLVGMGNPRQEIWAAEWGNTTGATVMCVGAFLDFTAGVFSRAPKWVRAVRCEWLYRFVQEPYRLFRRYFVNAPTFLLVVAKQRLRLGGSR